MHPPQLSSLRWTRDESGSSPGVRVGSRHVFQLARSHADGLPLDEPPQGPMGQALENRLGQEAWQPVRGDRQQKAAGGLRVEEECAVDLIDRGVEVDRLAEMSAVVSRATRHFPGGGIAAGAAEKRHTLDEELGSTPGSLDHLGKVAEQTEAGDIGRPVEAVLKSDAT